MDVSPAYDATDLGKGDQKLIRNYAVQYLVALTPVHDDIVDKVLIERGRASAGLAGPETHVPPAARPQAPRRAKVAARSVPRTQSRPGKD